MSKQYYVYILTNKRYGTLYIGVTSNILKRMYEHKSKMMKGFTSTYNVDKLVYLEEYQNINDAIHREKRLKYYPRDWKINLIERENPEWLDLYPEMIL